MTRARQQERTRTSVLAAATAEFAEHGYAAAKVDRIAERAELTRGAVYSNFPSKRSLYLAVLLDSIPEAPAEDTTAPDVGGGAEAFARAWLERLPLVADQPAAGRLRARSLSGVFDDEPGRAAMAALTRLEGLLLALALESCRARRPGRRVRLAELILTLLDGAGHRAGTAPAFGDPFDVARACRHLTGLDLADTWDPPHLPYIAPAQPCSDPWQPPTGLTDALSGRPMSLAGTGLVVVLGTGRLGGAEEAIRAARPGDSVTVAVVTGDPAELGALARLRITDFVATLHRVFGPAFSPSLRLIIDGAPLADAIGAGCADNTEAAVRFRSGRITSRAYGRGAGHAAAVADPVSPEADVAEGDRGASEG